MALSITATPKSPLRAEPARGLSLTAGLMRNGRSPYKNAGGELVSVLSCSTAWYPGLHTADSRAGGSISAWCPCTACPWHPGKTTGANNPPSLLFLTPTVPCCLGKMISSFPPTAQLLTWCCVQSDLSCLCFNKDEHNMGTCCQQILPVTRKTAENKSFLCDTAREKSDVMTTGDLRAVWASCCSPAHILQPIALVPRGARWSFRHEEFIASCDWVEFYDCVCLAWKKKGK